MIVQGNGTLEINLPSKKKQVEVFGDLEKLDQDGLKSTVWHDTDDKQAKEALGIDVGKEDKTKLATFKTGTPKGSLILLSNVVSQGTSAGPMGVPKAILESHKIDVRVTRIMSMVEVDEEELIDEATKISNSKGYSLLAVLKSIEKAVSYGSKLPWR